MNKFLFIIVVSLNFSSVDASTKYLSIDRSIYWMIEYDFLMQDSIEVFVMHQPYKDGDIHFNSSERIVYSARNAEPLDSDEGLSMLFKPGWGFYTVNQSPKTYPSVYADGYVKIGKFIGTNRLIATKALKQDPDFHGDTGEWVSAYFMDAYALYNASDKLTLFSGRTARNIGIPNEYGLFLSDNPYPYDLFGFTAKGKKLQYSWYTGRLNNMHGIDIAGVAIPEGETELTNRFLAFQRLDIKLSNIFQIGLSEAALYGGPWQSFSGPYLNPMNFYYLSQRNQIVLMNGSWQLNAFYLNPKRWALYIDLYIDDFIINNDEGIDDRAVHPDRLALMAKMSFPNLLISRSVSSIRYVRIWNETYVSYRNYENWVYFNKGLGFPKRSFESLKFQTSFFENKRWQATFSIEFWQHGDRLLLTTFLDEANIEFPAQPTTNGIDLDADVYFFYGKYDATVNIKYSSFKKQFELQSSDLRVMMSINYRFNIQILK